jgi:hypothetical protein
METVTMNSRIVSSRRRPRRRRRRRVRGSGPLSAIRLYKVFI